MGGALEIRDPRAPHGKSYLATTWFISRFLPNTLDTIPLSLTHASRSVEEDEFTHLAHLRPPRILCATEFCLETNEIHENKLIHDIALAELSSSTS